MGKPKSYVLNIDAQWGDGKTFFLEGLRAQLSEEGYPVAYVDAWADDHADDPMIAVVGAIDRVLAPLVSSNQKLKKNLERVKESASKITRTVAVGLVKQVSRKLIGDATEAVVEELGELKGVLVDASEGVAKETDNAIDVFFEQRDEIKTFRETLSSILASLKGMTSQKLPLFVLIDELDRCRPPYAISMLERVKHLFELDEVVFVVATDSEQLRHAICSVYGDRFASGRYLSRFFDRTFKFRTPTHQTFLESMFGRYKFTADTLSSPPDNDHVQFFTKVVSEYGVALRDIEQCFDMLRSIVTVWPWRARVELAVLLPLIVFWQQKKEEYLNVFTDQNIRRDLANDYNQSRQPILFLGRDGVGATQKSSSDVTNLLLGLVADSDRTFEEHMNSSSMGDPQNRWRRALFNHELSVTLEVDGTGHRSQSNLRHYPELVRSAGRMKNSET